MSKSEKQGKKCGRPKAILDTSRIEEYALSGASVRDIAGALEVDEAVIRRRYKKIVDKARADRHILLRKAQTAAALGGNPTVLIWLGKNELGQTDAMDLTSGGKPCRFFPITLEGDKEASDERVNQSDSSKAP